MASCLDDKYRVVSFRHEEKSRVLVRIVRRCMATMHKPAMHWVAHVCVPSNSVLNCLCRSNSVVLLPSLSLTRTSSLRLRHGRKQGALALRSTPRASSLASCTGHCRSRPYLRPWDAPRTRSLPSCWRQCRRINGKIMRPRTLILSIYRTAGLGRGPTAARASAAHPRAAIPSLKPSTVAAPTGMRNPSFSATPPADHRGLRCRRAQ